MSAIPALRQYARQYADILGCRGVAFAEQGFGASMSYMAFSLVEAALGTRIPKLHARGEDWLDAGQQIGDSGLRTALERGFISREKHAQCKKELHGIMTPDGLLNRVANIEESNRRHDYQFAKAASDNIQNTRVLPSKS